MDFDNSQLKSVFQLCSPDSEGYILTEYLADKLAQQFSDSTLVAIQNALDPKQIGRISFPQFCLAVTKLQGNEAHKIADSHICGDDNDSSDPEITYNEYDIAEDELPDMDNLEAIGESPHLSPNKFRDSSDLFKRNSSFRKSHRRVRSWTMKTNIESSTFENDDTSSVASEYDDLSEKIGQLQNHVSRLEEDKTLQSQYEALKQENHGLTNRVNELEEKLQDLSDRNDEIKQNSQKKLENLEREHALEMQVLQSKLDMLNSDNERLKSELEFSKNNAKESRESLNNLQSQTEILTNQIMETNDEYRRLNKRLATQQDLHEMERAKLKEEAEEAKRKLSEYQQEIKTLKDEISESQFDPTTARIRAHVDHLKAENEELKKNNEELTDQLAQQISEARLLVSGTEEGSIADELSSATRDEVMDALKKQEHINEQLRDYLERITLSILEQNPDILEIK